MAGFHKPSFSRGEVTPSAFGRIDLDAYGNGLALCRNFVTRVHGGLSNRSGTDFVCEFKDSTKKGRLIPFVFSISQSYILLHTAALMNVVKEGGLVLESAKAITATTNATPVVITSAAHGFANGNRIFVTGTGIPALDDRFWIVANQATNTLELQGSTAPGSTSATGTAARVFELATPYAENQLPAIKYTQLNDLMTMTHQGVIPKNLTRSAHDAWTLADMVFEQGPFQDVNIDKTKTVQASAATGTGVTLTAVGHTPFKSEHVGMLFFIQQKDYGLPWEVGKAINAGDIRRSDGKYYRAGTTATTGTLRPSHDSDFASDGGVNWQYVHNGYGVAQITGFTSSTVVTATVLNELPADVVSAATYKWAFGAWGGDQGWPAVVSYFQQRRVLAATPSQPLEQWFSATNSFNHFGRSSPIVDDDAFNMTLASNQSNPIRHLVDIGKLVAFTAASASDVRPITVGGGKWIIPDDDNNPVLTPTKRSARPQGADYVLYVEEKGQTVQDLAYQFASNSYSGSDLSVLSKHLLEKHTIVAAAYQHVPFQILWLVRDDGVLLGMTYHREQQIWGWHHHDTMHGYFEDVACISEGGQDVPYFIVRRFINGQTRRFVEKLSSRLFTDIKDAQFVDCAVKYDGRNTSAVTMTITGGTNWTIGENFTLTASAAKFKASDVTSGAEIHFTANDGRILRLLITGFTSTTVVTVTGNRTVAAELRGVALTAWGFARKAFDHLDHFEGETVSILADGHVHPQLVVIGGAVTLQYCAVVARIGLPITADMQTLRLNIAASGGLLDNLKNLVAVRLMVEESRGIFAGTTLDDLFEYAQRRDENYDEPVRALTGVAALRVRSSWDQEGQFYVRQSEPLPLSISAVIPEFEVGGKQ